MARNLRNHLWRIFEYAIDTGLIEDNPVPPVRALRKRNQHNHPALDAAQLRDFLRQLDATESLNIETRLAMRLVVLTACRKNEVVGARWGEFDLAVAAWKIPAARMKTRRAHWVPLSRQAIAALHALREIVPEESAILFPNRIDPTRPMSSNTVSRMYRRTGCARPTTGISIRTSEGPSCRRGRTSWRPDVLGFVPELEHDGIVPAEACGEKSPALRASLRLSVPRSLGRAQAVPSRPSDKRAIFRT